MKSYNNIDARRKSRNKRGVAGRKSGGGSSFETVEVNPHRLSWKTHRGPGSANCIQTAVIDGSDDIFIRNSNDPTKRIRGNKAELKAFAIAIPNGAMA